MSSDYLPVPGSERDPLPGATLTGPADPGQELKVTVLTRRRPDARLPEVLDQLSGQPIGERRYLSREELAAQHGADPADGGRPALTGSGGPDL